MKTLLRKLISRLANLTPEVVYYAKGWPVRINELATSIEAKKGGTQSALSTAAVSICCAMHEKLKVGDTATIRLTGVTYRGEDVGHFVVTAKRVNEEDAA